MPEQITLITNPRSTRVDLDVRARAEALLRPFGLMESLVTAHHGHGAELASRAVADGATIVVALGGDGTVNEVAGVVAGSGAAVLPLPGGSTNVFARALGWPHPAPRAFPEVERALREPHIRVITLGRVTAGSTDRVFCVNAGMGLDAETVDLVERHPWLKTRFRHAGFAAATAATLARGALRRPALDLAADGDRLDVAAVAVACGAPYAYLGRRPLELVPGASYDGRLRWIALRSAGVGGVCAALTGALRGGTHVGRANVRDGWAATEISVRSEQPVAVQADGEALGRHTDTRFTPGPELRVLALAGR